VRGPQQPLVWRPSSRWSICPVSLVSPLVVN